MRRNNALGYLLAWIGATLLLAGCPKSPSVSPAQTLPAGPEEKVFSLYSNRPLTVPIEANEAVVYRFDAKITSEGLYQFETTGQADTLCALVHKADKSERFLVVRDIGGKKENCRIVWAFPPGVYHFKVRVDGRNEFGVHLRPMREGRVIYNELPADQKPYSNQVDHLGDRHRFAFSLKAPRLLQFRVSGKGQLQCTLRTQDGKWLSAPLYRQPFGSCTVGQWLQAGSYVFELRSNRDRTPYKLWHQKVRLQTLPSNQMREGYLRPKVFDLFKVELKPGRRHTIQTYGSHALSCTLEDMLGNKIASHTSAPDRRNCLLTGQFKPGNYYLRVQLREGSGGPYQISLLQQSYVNLSSKENRTITPDFQQPMQLYRIQVDDARLYQIEVKGRKVRCLLSNVEQETMTVMNLSEPKRCLLFANLYRGAYFLQVYPTTREDSSYQLSVIEYKPPKGNLLQDQQPRLIGPVYPSYRRAFTLKIDRSQLLVLETRGRLDTKCELYNTNNRRIAKNDDGGRDYNCRINRYLRPGTYHLRIRITGRRSGIFWVQRRAKKLPWVELGRDLPVAFKFRKQRLTYMLRVQKPGLFGIHTESNLDTMCSILNQDWDQIAKDDDSGTKKNCFLAHYLNPGIYPIQIWLYRKNQGKIRVRVDRLSLQQSALGQRTAGRLSPPSWSTFYRLQITQPGLYVLRTFGSTDTKCTLRNERSQTVTYNDDRNRSDKNCQIIENLMPGIYFFQVHLYKRSRRNANQGMPYQVFFNKLRSPITNLTLNQQVTVQMKPGNIRRYRFQIKQAGRYRIETSGLLDPKCVLYSDSYRKLSSDDDRGSGRNCRIVHFLSPGTYELQVRPATNDLRRSRGPYKVGVFRP